MAVALSGILGKPTQHLVLCFLTVKESSRATPNSQPKHFQHESALFRPAELTSST